MKHKLSSLTLFIISLSIIGCDDRNSEDACPEMWQKSEAELLAHNDIDDGFKGTYDTIYGCTCDQYANSKYNLAANAYTCSRKFETWKKYVQNNINEDQCPSDPDKLDPGVCGCGTPDIHVTLKNVYVNGELMREFNYTFCQSICPSDSSKLEPGVCGCGLSDNLIAKNGKSFYWCEIEKGGYDFCPEDPAKTQPGLCGCGQRDKLVSVPRQNGETFDSYKLDCVFEDSGIDLCPEDDTKVIPGFCGCGQPDFDESMVSPGTPQCVTADLCPDDPNKMVEGQCGCGHPDTDSDGDGTADCLDACPNLKEKTQVGLCGCDILDTDDQIADNDNDGTINCQDVCPDFAYKQVKDECTETDPLDHSRIVTSCTAIKDSSTNACAEVIDSAEALVALRDAWNAGLYDVKTVANANSRFSRHRFILMQDINLGDVLNDEEDATWQGIGTLEHPFFGHFNGNGHSIKATTPNGTPIRLGLPDNDNVGLFGVIAPRESLSGSDENDPDTVIENLTVELTFEGRNQVGILAGRIGPRSKQNDITIQNVSVGGTVSGDVNVGGVVGTMTDGRVLNSLVFSNVIATTSKQTIPPDANFDQMTNVENGNIGGFAGKLEHVKINAVNANATNRLEATPYAENIGGFAGAVTNSTMLNVAVKGKMTSYKTSGGFVGLLADSTILNSYTAESVTCKDVPCAGFVATTLGESVIVNVYAIGALVPEIHEEIVDPPEPDGERTEPDASGNTPQTDTLSYHSIECPTEAPEEDGEDNDSGADTPTTEGSSCTPIHCVAEPYAAFISEVCGDKLKLDQAFAGPYEQLTLPDDLKMAPDSVNTSIQPFQYKALQPYLRNTTLIKSLNDYRESKTSLCRDQSCRAWSEVPYRVDKTTFQIPDPTK